MRDIASRGCRSTSDGMSVTRPTPNQQVVPRPVRPLGRAGVLISGATRPMTDLPKAYTPRDVEGAIYERWLAADVFAPDGAGSTADPALPPFTIIQPPPNVTGLAAPGPRAADRGRGPDDPPRPDARARRAVPAGAGPRQHRRPVRARRHHRQGGREPAVAGSRAVSRTDARVLGLHEARDARPAAARGCLGRLGPAALHDGRGVGHVGADRVRAALSRRPGVPHRGARELVSGLPDQRERSRGRVDARDRHALVGPLPPRGPVDRRARSVPGRVHHGRHDPPGDDPR